MLLDDTIYQFDMACKTHSEAHEGVEKFASEYQLNYANALLDLLLFKKSDLADQIKNSIKFDKKYNLDVIMYKKFHKGEDEDESDDIMSDNSKDNKSKLQVASTSGARICTYESLNFEDVE